MLSGEESQIDSSKNKQNQVGISKQNKSQQKFKKNEFFESDCRGSTFYMGLSDFSKYFYISTISFTNKHYEQSFMSDQLFSHKWGAFHLNMPVTENNCFVSLFQMNDRFMDNVDLGTDDYEYPNTTLIVAKYLKIAPKT